MSRTVYTMSVMRASDRAYTVLREDILEGSLGAGTFLTETDLSGRLGVSRTPIREALARLISEGLAAHTGSRGTVVSSISLDDVGHLFELRIPLEVQAARLAAVRGEPDQFFALAEKFHAAQNLSIAGREAEYYDLVARLDHAIDAAMANPYVTSALAALRVQLVRVRRLAQDNPVRLKDSAREHQEMCQAIAHQDPDLAAATTQTHLLRSLAYISGYAEALSDAQLTPQSVKNV